MGERNWKDKLEETIFGQFYWCINYKGRRDFSWKGIWIIILFGLLMKNRN